MNFKLIIGILLICIHHFHVSSLEYNNCHKTVGSKATIALVCEQRVIPSACYSMYINSSAVDTKRDKVEVLNYNRCEDDQHINISSNFINRFPGLHTIKLSNTMLIKLSFYVNRTKSVTVQIINASKNYLSEMPTSMFQCMPNLERIDFSKNKIKNIGSNVFEGGAKLKFIDLSNNRLTNLSHGTFLAAGNLEILDLSENQITSIDNGLFVKNEKMNILNLRGNPVKRFDFNVFALEARSIINLLVEWKKVEWLDISCSRTICYSGNFNDSFENLQFLNASGNSNQSALLDKVGSDLISLDFSWNLLPSTDILNRFTKLMNLFLSHMLLFELVSDAFPTNLRQIDLSWNNLTDINLTFFSRRFYHLNALNLEGNRLIEPNNISPFDFPKLQTLAISRNNLSCTFLEKFLNEWKHAQEIKLIGNPSSYQFNIEGIDCYFQTNKEKGESLEYNIETASIWMYFFVPVSIAIMMLEFMVIVIMCGKSQKQRVEISNEFPEYTDDDNNIANIFFKGVTTTNDNLYEEIPLQLPLQFADHLLYDVPQGATPQKCDTSDRN